MKKTLPMGALLLSSFVLLHSCKTSSVSLAQRKSDIENSKETSAAACFVQLKDGTVKNYNTLKLVTSTFADPYLLGDGKTKIKASEITAYQNKDHYAISQTQINSGRNSHVATEALPGFAVRTVKGKINVYCKKYYNGQFAVNEYYLQIGTHGDIMVYSKELMNNIVRDNPEAYSLFNSKQFKGNLQEKLHATAHLYNDGQMMTKK